MDLATHGGAPSYDYQQLSNKIAHFRALLLFRCTRLQSNNVSVKRRSCKSRNRAKGVVMTHGPPPGEFDRERARQAAERLRTLLESQGPPVSEQEAARNWEGVEAPFLTRKTRLGL